jgi:HEAT repeat protein
MINLLKDQNKTVRLAAYKALGTFIHELKGGKISQELITEFCRMVENDVVNLGSLGK